MRVINYNRGYINFFDCVIHGRIVVTNAEWGKIRKYALPHAFNDDDFTRFMSVKGGRWYNIRTTATALVAKKFNLKGYKQGNYVIEVLN